VPRTTVQDYRNSKRAQRDCELNTKRLTKLEEEVVLQYILKYSVRGLLVLKADVRDIANRLLRDCASKPVSKN
jgi:hypothetical protein